MSLQVGLVGLPNVGKSTLFNALTQSQAAEAANFPFCTIDPNVGTVPLKDHRLDQIAQIAQAKKTIYEAIEFVDIAGLVKGASQGEGLGNQFLANIRECDAIAMVLRFFEDDDITHVSGTISPQDDLEIIQTELILADLQTVEKVLDKARKQVKSGKKEDILKAEVLEKWHAALSAGERAHTITLDEFAAESVREIQLLTNKPMIFVANCSENDVVIFDRDKAIEQLGLSKDTVIIPISAKIESELAQMDVDEAAMFLEDLGLTESGLQKLAHAANETLGICQYFTAGEVEARAWTIPVGATAPQAAGKIHTDFEKKFIRADVVDSSAFIEHGGWSKCREQGLVKSEGKEAVIHDGDVCLFKTGA